jgi:ABC-type nickel/cobalt efflux system permease component RcnA
MFETLAAAAPDGFRLSIVATALAFGLRHGIDWDHIAAIADITGSQDDARRSLGFATLYALGHGLVVLALGLAAIELGSLLPPQVDAIMESLVGITLLVLGVYVFYALVRHGRNFRMRSRWMLLFGALRLASIALGSRRARSGAPVAIDHEHDHSHDDPLHAAHAHSSEPALGTGSPGPQRTALRSHRHAHRHVGEMPADPVLEYGATTALAVGMIHGVGAETPTQVLLFASAVGAGGRVSGAITLVSFTVGLLASNTLVALASTFGFLRAGRSWPLYAAVSVAVGIASLALGLLFVLGRGAVLPAIIGG